jgi:hypothetical protein
VSRPDEYSICDDHLTLTTLLPIAIASFINSSYTRETLHIQYGGRYFEGDSAQLGAGGGFGMVIGLWWPVHD